MIHFIRSAYEAFYLERLTPVVLEFPNATPPLRKDPAMTAKRLLIVEDEAIVAMALSRALSRLGYHICRVFASGEEALAAIDSEQPHLILMDIHLAGAWDGIQTSERIRAAHRMPIVFMTGYDVGEIEDKTKHIENVAYVGKPVGVAVLTQIIETSLASTNT